MLPAHVRETAPRSPQLLQDLFCGTVPEHFYRLLATDRKKTLRRKQWRGEARRPFPSLWKQVTESQAPEAHSFSEACRPPFTPGAWCEAQM